MADQNLIKKLRVIESLRHNYNLAVNDALDYMQRELALAEAEIDTLAARLKQVKEGTL